jgi:hypothetical protein
MKLHILQRLALKVGIPLHVLNEWAAVYYGDAIPNAEGRYPDWWYIQQGLPTTYRDFEVPKEVLKKEKSREKNLTTNGQRGYVKVEHGKVVGIVSHGSGVATAPHPSSNSNLDSNRLVHDNHRGIREEVRRYMGQTSSADMDEVVRRVVAAMEAGSSGGRTSGTSVPATKRYAACEDDIMSFIHDENASVYRNSRAVEVEPHNPYLQSSSDVLGPQYANVPHCEISDTRQTFPTTTRTRSGPQLPSSPRPAESTACFQNRDSIMSNNSILGYYSSPIPEYRKAPLAGYHESQQDRNVTARTIPEENSMSEWSGYDSPEAVESEWEDESSLLGRTAKYRQATLERLAQYRRKY